MRKSDRRSRTAAAHTDDLLTVAKKHKLRWYGQVAKEKKKHPGLYNDDGKEDSKKKKKRWEDVIDRTYLKPSKAEAPPDFWGSSDGRCKGGIVSFVYF